VPQLVLALLLLTGAAHPALGQELILSVAVSMKEAIEEVGRHYERTHRGVTLRYNLGASGDLQKQIEAGAPADLFISAAPRQMDELERLGLIVASSRRVFARNLLTVIAPSDSRLQLRSPADLLQPRVQRIVIGNPKTVPAGQYAEASFRALGLWEPLRPKLVFAENVRQALEYVSRGEVEAGVVYATDAAVRAGRIKEVFRPPVESYPPVTYPVATVATSRNQRLAQAFIDLLLGREGQAVLARHGFQPPGGAAP
jgi:molybdate transport system substrate-binding protein